ncbi:alpha-glucan family phosphorylase [Nevskia soli]|uniref:alpha-glucan family phosphorylase n=1 Tax=Nevskia soli TaxID=418856 RepID=UPI0004A6EDDD|nr:alpha-glucan family phosphorylase [Nevskia soli]
MQIVSRPMPPGLESLPDLALNVRWTWSHAADRLWLDLAPDIWSATHNPWLLLQTVPQARLDECARDEAFLRNLARVTALRMEYLTQPTWCSQFGSAKPPLVAYFCLEFGLAEAMPLYAGGLGILAGDTLKTASDLGVPMVGVGLMYSEGYFRQVLDADGYQHELFPPNVPSTLPVAPAFDSSGVQLSIRLELPGRSLSVQVWKVQVGRVSLLLLDCNDPRNSAADRGITATLYPAGLETRFVQQLVLGIAGWRVLEALGYIPEVCHFNEGNAALVALERIRALMQEKKLGFLDALWTARAGNVFTTHTPVAAAFDTFPTEMVLKYLRHYLEEHGIGEEDFLALGRCNRSDGAEPFNPSYFGLRTAGRINGVSQIHRDVSRNLYQRLYPRRPMQEIPVEYVTNGVHVPSWDSAWSDEIWTEACGKRRWHGGLDEMGPSIEALNSQVLWGLRSKQRADLVTSARQRLARQLHQTGRDASLIEAATHVLDPNVLTLGFARRFTSYKRPNLLLHDPERLARLLRNTQHPVQFIVAGKAHPQDEAGKTMIRQWVQFSQRPDVRGRVVFLEDYDIDLAREMVQGIDVWINTPRRPWEACGTSGMKVLVNGGLNLSELDGWWVEAYTPKVGWGLQGAALGEEAAIDANEAETLYRLLEQEVVPLFYARDAEGIAQGWVTMMRTSMSILAPRFSSNRMLREYFESVYCPAATAFAQRLADGARLASELRAWASALRAGWHEIRFSNYEHQRDGDCLRFSLHLYLGEILPDSVSVEMYADAAGDDVPGAHVMRRGSAIPGGMNAYVYIVEVQTRRPATDFTPRVVPFHPCAAVPLELELIRWHDAGD